MPVTSRPPSAACRRRHRRRRARRRRRHHRRRRRPGGRPRRRATTPRNGRPSPEARRTGPAEARPHDHEPTPDQERDLAGGRDRRAGAGPHHRPAEGRQRGGRRASLARPPDPRLTTVPARGRERCTREDRYAMANGCYPLTTGGDPLFFRADRPRRLPPLRRRAPLRRRRPAAGPTEPRDRHRLDGRAATAAGLTFTNAGEPAERRRALRVPAHADRPAAPPTPSPRSTSSAPRTPASRRTRRSAGTSTRTPTAWRSSSSAAAPTAASRGTGTARRTRSSTAPTTATGGNGAVLEAVLSGRARPRPGRLADVQGLAGAGVAHPRGHLLQVARALLARRAADLREPAGREQPAVPALPAEARPSKNSCDDMDSIRLQAQRTCTSCRTTSTRSAAGPARAGTGSSRAPGEARQGHQRREARRGHGHRDQRAVRLHLRRSRRRRPDRATSPSIDRQLDEVHALGVRQMELVNKFDNALSGVAGDSGRARRRPSTAPTSSRPARTGTCGTASRPTPDAHDQNQFAAPGDRRRAAGRPVRRDRPALRAAPSRCRSTRRPTTATAAGSPTSASTSSSGWPSGTCSSTPTT